MAAFSKRDSDVEVSFDTLICRQTEDDYYQSAYGELSFHG